MTPRLFALRLLVCGDLDVECFLTLLSLGNSLGELATIRIGTLLLLNLFESAKELVEMNGVGQIEESKVSNRRHFGDVLVV